MINHKHHYIIASYTKISIVDFTEVDNQLLTL
jgi:hypothetical protein